MVVLRRERDVSIIIDGALVDVVEEVSKCQNMFRVEEGIMLGDSFSSMMVRVRVSSYHRLLTLMKLARTLYVLKTLLFFQILAGTGRSSVVPSPSCPY